MDKPLKQVISHQPGSSAPPSIRLFLKFRASRCTVSWRFWVWIFVQQISNHLPNTQKDIFLCSKSLLWPECGYPEGCKHTRTYWRKKMWIKSQNAKSQFSLRTASQINSCQQVWFESVKVFVDELIIYWEILCELFVSSEVNNKRFDHSVYSQYSQYNFLPVAVNKLLYFSNVTDDSSNQSSIIVKFSYFC